MPTQIQAQLHKTETTADTRQIVGFSFYRIDPAWCRLPAATKKAQGKELAQIVERFSKRLLVRTYSLVGLKAEVDFLIWRVGKTLDELQEMSAAVRGTALGGYLTMPYAYTSMTKRSTYVDKLDPEHQDRRRFITFAGLRYLFVYPFVKTREW